MTNSPQELSTSVIRVEGENPYDVQIGYGIRFDVAQHLGKDVKKVFLMHQPNLASAARDLKEELSEKYEVVVAEIPDLDGSKRIEVAAFCWQLMGQAGFTRSDAVIGFGGGAATDIAGFVAATWLRGVKVVLIPTTVLGVVDAAIGGKTAINTNEGKNLVGAFHAPAAVVVDLDTLATLDRKECLNGFAEIVKYGFIAEPEILDLIEGNFDAATNTDSAEFRRIAELCIGVKARIVAQDFREAGPREVLNYGHTLGHAIEYAERYMWRHGSAISVGMVYAAEVARFSGRLSDAVADRHRTILSSLDQPVQYPAGRWKTLYATMHRDKKARGDVLRFIVLDDIAKPVVLNQPDESLLYAAYQEIGS